MSIPLPPTPPSITDPENFAERADAWNAWVADTFVPQLNTIIGTTIPAGSAAAGTLTGDTIAANVVNSSLETLGALDTISGAAAGGVWVGTGSNTVAQLPAVATPAAHATTMNPWVAREIVPTGGAVTFTDIADAPYVGAVAWVKQPVAHIWTDGATFDIQGNKNYVAGVGDWIRIYATTVSTFEITIFRQSSTPVIQVFTSSGTYTPTPGIRWIRVTATGGGSGGGGASTNNGAAGSGGGAGGTGVKIIAASALGTTESVTIGAAGAAGTPGNNGSLGGTTSFGAHAVTGTAGAAGAGSTTAVNGSATNGGSGTGDLVIPGGTGAGGLAAIAGGSGGGSIYGSGPMYAGSSGSAGSPEGVGGSGSYRSGGSDVSGGAGVKGKLVVEEFF